MKLIYIEWMDACAFGGRFKIDGSAYDWADTDWSGKDGSLLSKVTTVGFLVRKTKHDITVCTSIFTSSTSVAELMTIPRAWIAHITRARFDR